MSSIELTVNSKHHATVSLEDQPGVLSCILNNMARTHEDPPEDSYHLSLGGIDNTAGEFVNWERVDLEIGDEITFKLLDESVANPKPSRRIHDGEKAEYTKKDYIRKCAKDFGWTIIEDSEKTDQN
ncbi:hypothetical protein OAB00_03250 [Akkermansiaceae bacterium]|nr:hypothetical protein [Akkermansiaceae bacterium]